MKILSTFILFFLFTFNLFSQKITFQELVEIQNMINAKCPKMVDKYTRLEYSVAKKQNNHMTLVSYYTAVDWLKSEIKVESLKKLMKDHVINLVANDEDFKVFRDTGIDIIYNYYDKNGVFIFQIIVTPEDYRLKI